MNIILALLIGNFFFTEPTPVSFSGQLCLQINHIASTEGRIWIAVYSSDQDFLDRSKAQLFYIDVNGYSSQKVDLGMLPYGEYAIAIFHDWNNNDELDFNWFGIPVEPFAFSSPLSSKWRKPDFSDVKFTIGQNQKILTLQLDTWRDL